LLHFWDFDAALVREVFLQTWIPNSLERGNGLADTGRRPDGTGKGAANGQNEKNEPQSPISKNACQHSVKAFAKRYSLEIAAWFPCRLITYIWPLL
jgi:hypothetical protein